MFTRTVDGGSGESSHIKTETTFKMTVANQSELLIEKMVVSVSREWLFSRKVETTRSIYRFKSVVHSANQP